jgi:hypothetical protein
MPSQEKGRGESIGRMMVNHDGGGGGDEKRMKRDISEGRKPYESFHSI